MIQAILQIKNGIPYPSSDEDRDKLRDGYHENQLIRADTYRVSKDLEPSIAQNNTMHACFELVANNHPDFKTKAQVKFSTKVELRFVHEDRIAVRPDGTVQFDYRSFSFKELKNMERLNIFNRAFDYLAGLLGITVDELVAEAKKRMRSF